jgi:NADP-dependent 3-hydroxy acid dehydrogenase YdfG
MRDDHFAQFRPDFADDVTNPEMKAQLAASRDKFAMSPDAITRAIALAIEQPADIDVNEIVIRPTAQGRRCRDRLIDLVY